MIVVWMELWPGGDSTHARSLGMATITNDGSGTHLRGNYNVVLYKGGKKRSTYKQTRVEGFTRRRSNAWKLLYTALMNAFDRYKDVS